MFKIKSKETDQESKLLTLSCHEKEHKIMIQGAYQNLDIFIDDYPNLSCLKLSTKLQVRDVVHPDLELSRTSPIDENTNDNLDDDHQTKTCSMTEFQENNDYEAKDICLKYHSILKLMKKSLKELQGIILVHS